ncbi:AAA family ATPase [Yersinia enterocolitica]|nr:AAA family ATPase [Yersinia enterocolitica]ELI8062935.1 AAA family ATPase [Yersinia enterocolitica]
MSIIKDAEIIPDGFDTWLSDRPLWMQTAAKLMVDKRRLPNNTEINQLAKLCIEEASKVPSNSFDTLKPGMLSQASIRYSLRLKAINDVHGVNAIKNGAALNFGTKNLSVIYGSNGSGKSGYSRLLKEICGSRAKETLHPNVFENNNPPARAKVLFQYNDLDQEIAWTIDNSPIPSLRNIHIFDSKTATVYMSDKNEATYEPSRMRFISSLIKVCDQVSAELNEGQRLLVKKLPSIPPELLSSPASLWLAKLTAKTSQLVIDKECLYTKELDGERIAGEAALAEKDILGRLKIIERERSMVIQIRGKIAPLISKLSDTDISNLIMVHNDSINKRKIATEDAKKVFSNVPLDGVGQGAWMALWEQARLFSETGAYIETKFPNTGEPSLCVLCQQELSSVAKQRLRDFEAFVIGGLEKNAKEAEIKYSNLLKTIPLIPKVDEWITDLGYVKIAESEARRMLLELQTRRTIAETATVKSDVPIFDWKDINTALDSTLERLLIEEKALIALQQNDTRKALEARVVQLKGIQWLNQNRQPIMVEHDRLKSYEALTKALTLTRTNNLTAKKNELSVQELNAGYLERFAQELKALGGSRLPVKAQSFPKGKGVIVFGVALNGSYSHIPANSVLSEGESRIVALSAFLADMTGMNQSTPFIFDDPISSLDQDFEEKVVSRLIELSKERQVIVFTHRLSFLTQIESNVKKIQEQAKLQKTLSAADLHIETLRRLGAYSGLAVPLNIRNSKPKAALNHLQNESLKHLRNLHDDLDIDQYDNLSKSICSDFRIVMERCVESILLNDVLQRFRRDIQTKGRIGSLAKIQIADCLFFDDLMTRYSVFEHSQSDEFPAEPVELDDLESDVKSLISWIEGFEGRAVN